MASILFVAGDPSGDAHAARLIEALKQKNPGLAFTGLGGAAMQRAGLRLLCDLTAAAAIGPFDAFKHLSRFRQARRLVENALKTNRPDLVILVDFGDFNLPVIAPLVKRYGVPIVYYISPQIWAWGAFRLRYVKQNIDRMLVFFRFEEAFYQKENIPVTWVGHPLVDAVKPALGKEAAMRQFGLNPWRRVVGLLPGSRKREIQRHLPVMLAAAKKIAWRMPGVQFLLVKAPEIPDALVARYVKASEDIKVVEAKAAEALQVMEAAVVSSGTATLETALCGIPMVVIYRTSWMTYLAAKAVIRIPDIALVNVVAQKRLVPELVQQQASPSRIANAVIELLRNDEAAARIKEGLQKVAETLGPPGAVERTVAAVLEMLALGQQGHKSGR